MRLATVEYEKIERVGIVEDDALRLLPAGTSLAALLSKGRISVSDLQPTECVAVAEVRFLPPIPRPEKIICAGLNYRDHAAEADLAIPDKPPLFIRFPSSQVGHLEPIVVPRNSTQFDFEGELAVIIGAPARHVTADEALSHVAGYTCFADNSARDFQMHSRQATPGKNFLASGAMGPWIVTADEVDDVAKMELRTRINGVEMQHGSLADLIFPVEALIAYISSFTRLMPGDVVATGTPAGVGLMRKPPVWLKPGDELEIDISGVGRLANPVRAEN